ncbi:hypothetical protein SCOR_26185 [Sulfidibacter corallicola]|uniref:Uncharacterized protein n=1 Tax=Sulfidibacter corallicola TaxID=2818388 RepID=A0A8A4TRU3_SULCO|nr:hypothetical protein [Sulfidibacter corallicola]QTD52117.1 hypothetical protein J3U87_06550 [Sulfidibacter corallicola]
MNYRACTFWFTAVLLIAPFVSAQDKKGIEFFGNIYTKFLDGNRRTNTALYNNSEFGNGDQGQGTEFELMFRSKVSRQIEIGGRLKARFDRNFWTNGGGFADDENEPRSAQYMKFRGAYVRVTPGYRWIDSAVIGSNDWGQFDAFTIGKIRYIDRDNVSGILIQGSEPDRKQFRWDFARVSLPKLWAGPSYSTGDLHQMDAAYAVQMKYDSGKDFDVTGIFEYINDQEIDATDPDNRDGVELTQRYRNSIVGFKFNWSPSDYVDLAGAFYRSEFATTFNGDGDFVRFNPTLLGDDEDTAVKVNLDFNDLFDVLTINVEYFDFGASYMSVMAARRESDVLLTEGHDGAWGWSRPDYNIGSNDRGSSRAGIGYGGWDGNAHQVISLAADNDFTDFDESMAESVAGWKGFTIVPKWAIGDLEMEAEFTFVDYNSNWQNCGGTPCLYPTVDGVHSWGVGGDWRSPFGPYQEKETTIMLVKGSYIFEVGDGLEFKFKYKVIDDEDERVTDPQFLDDAYRLTTVEHVNYDDREADYTTIAASLGSQVTEDIFVEVWLEHYEVDLFDGTVEVTPAWMESWEPEFGWINYMTGDHERDKVALIIKYFLSGMEFGLNAQWIDGTYDPRFFRGENGQVVEFTPATAQIDVPHVHVPISTSEAEFDHYRLKAFMKVQF